MTSDPRFAKHLATLSKHVQAERGVLYFSSVPTDMRPNEVRLHFQQFGEVMRQKFVPFTIKHSASGKRLNNKQFKEGWLEFKRREDAMRAAALLNSKPVGVRRFRKAHGQIWNVKFLPDFSWDTLIEDKESAIRERKFKEHRAKEAERSANEMFRAMVAAKSNKKMAGLKRDREENEEEKEETTEETSSPAVAEKVSVTEGNKAKKGGSEEQEKDTPSKPKVAKKKVLVRKVVKKAGKI